MRCPKCQYISFDSADRCRNCGYEFALTADAPSFDLPIQTGNEAIGPLGDLPMTTPPARESPAAAARARAGRGRALQVPEDPPSPPQPTTGVFDLPLFKDRPLDDDTPLVAPSAVPRQPLAVRRSSPVVPRAPRVLTDDLVLELEEDEPDVPPTRHTSRPSGGEPRARASFGPPAEAHDHVAAGLVPRLLAGILDLAILVSICSIVLHITLRVCGLRLDQLLLLPAPPLAGFLLLLVGGYFVLLTSAGGQTMGKMAAGVRVVPMDSTGRVSLGSSAMRAAGYLVSLVPAGLGLVPALLHADRRALHDRLADTRVVKA
ncbi:MAG: RDD family protein [Acidobacteriota bacterium]|nr:RDD family protein [Acidobacteriota bacterium]